VGGFPGTTAAQSESGYVNRGHGEAVRLALADGNPVWAGSLRASSAIAIHRETRSRVQSGIPSCRDQLQSLTMPRTVLFGARSLPHPDLSALPSQGIRVAVVPDAGHSMMWENPAGLAAAIQHALD
jgi:pimeloyl-ACP methyl ester carboxylesterase